MCVSTLLLPPTTYYLISEEIDEEPAHPMQALCGGYCCFYGFLIRTRLREKYNLEGSIEKDMISHCLCHCFALAHDYCEAKAWKAELWNLSSPGRTAKPPEFPLHVQELEQGPQTTVAVVDPTKALRNGVQQREPDVVLSSAAHSRQSSLLERLDKLRSVEDQGQQVVQPDQKTEVQEMVTDQDRIDTILTNPDLIEEMRNQLSQDFDPGKPSVDVTIPQDIFVDVPLADSDGYFETQEQQNLHSQGSQTPAYLPRSDNHAVRLRELHSAHSDRGSSVSSAGYVELSSVGGALRVGVGRAGFFHVQQAHEVTPSGAREWGQYSVRPVETPPDYAGSGHYSSPVARRNYPSATSGR